MRCLNRLVLRSRNESNMQQGAPALAELQAFLIA
jgi:hypothetical protein